MDETSISLPLRQEKRMASAAIRFSGEARCGRTLSVRQNRRERFWTAGGWPGARFARGGRGSGVSRAYPSLAKTKRHFRASWSSLGCFSDAVRLTYERRVEIDHIARRESHLGEIFTGEHITGVDEN